MEPLNRDRLETRLESGEARAGASTQPWWQLGAGAALLLMAGGGVSARSLVRAAAVAGGAALVYRALTGPDGLLARQGTDPSAPTEADTAASTGARSSAFSPAGTSPSTAPRSATAVREEEPSLAGSDGIPPIDLRGA